MPWNKLVATLLPLLAIIEACGPTKEPLSTCFVRADNSVWTEHAMTAETFLPPKCPVILPGGVANQSEAYKVDFFAPKADVSVFNIVQVVHITPTGTVQSNVTFPFIPDPYSADAKAQAWGTYFAGVDGFGTPFNPVDSLVAHIPVNTGQLARGVAELRYQPGTLTLSVPGGNVGVPATASVSNISGLPGPYTFEWFLDGGSLGSTGSQSWITYTVNSYGIHRVDVLVRGANGLSIFTSEDPFFNDGDPGSTCIICDNP